MMPTGVVIDLHAAASTAARSRGHHVGEQVLTAGEVGFDLIVLPDHPSYRAGGDGDYALPDEAVGIRESVTEIAALAASPTRIGIGHSVVNAPYRSPVMLAHIAATLADISDGRYSLGIGVGNSFDYDQIGVAADRRVGRFTLGTAGVPDPLDIQGARTRSIETLQHLAGLGADEVRCYTVSDDTTLRGSKPSRR